tara:strand:+ start:499 stop:1281 length:783 start_codon:yes stop_codon:yes gene_type:complete
VTGRLDGKVALVTGAGGGIGRETCRLFAAEGARIVAVDINESACHETVSEIEASHPDHAISVTADVSSPEESKAMVAAAEETFGGLHVLFNNAGIMDPADGDAIDTTLDTWNRTLAINLTGVYLGCQAGIPAILRSGGGSIINTASFVALMGAATPQLAYTASKGGVLAMTRELAIIHARQNIRVNALCPGPLRTEMLMSFLDTDEKKHRRLVHIPMGRFGEASEMAQAALYLASDESSYVNGTEFVVDGGITSAYVTPE